MKILLMIVLCFAVTGQTGCRCLKNDYELNQDERERIVMAVNLMITDPYYYAHRIGQELPSIFWPQEVSKLHPIKVYFHRENVFIVISRNTKEERGYCVPPFSSAVCVPDFETDGWIWKNITNGFYEYRKDLRNAVFANQ